MRAENPGNPGCVDRDEAVEMPNSDNAVDTRTADTRLRRGWWGFTVGPWPAPTDRSREWSVRYALAALVLAVLIAAALGFAFDESGVEIPRGVGALIIDGALLVTLVPLYRSGALRAADLGLRRVPPGRSVGLAVLAFIAYVVVNRLWNSWVNPPPISSTFGALEDQSTAVIVLAGFAAVVSAPVIEEVFFRGFLYRSLRNRMGIVPACMIVGFVFGLGHTQYPLLVRPVLAAFGVIACLLYERTGSLLPGIAMHSFIDSSGFEFALTGRTNVVFDAFALLASLLLMVAFGKFVVNAVSSKDLPNVSTLQRMRKAESS
jgi:membrane protease YdiL (CAAX protease family)